jgi:hypothetical protein
MQRWYERTVEKVVPQTESVPDFLDRHGLGLLQLDDNQKSMLEEEFTIQEAKQAVQRQMRLVPPALQVKTSPFLIFSS